MSLNGGWVGTYLGVGSVFSSCLLLGQLTGTGMQMFSGVQLGLIVSSQDNMMSQLIIICSGTSVCTDKLVSLCDLDT